MTSYTLLANVNYSGSSTVISDAVPAAAYFYGYGSIQTIMMNVANFQGNITVKASLNDQADEALYFEVGNLQCPTATTVVQPVTVVGNFVWLRCEVDGFAAGNIVSVTASY